MYSKFKKKMQWDTFRRYCPCSKGLLTEIVSHKHRQRWKEKKTKVKILKELCKIEK